MTNRNLYKQCLLLFTMRKQIRKAKTKEKLKRVKVVCMNKDDLIKMAEFVKKNYDEIIKNYIPFQKILKTGFDENEGYFNFNNLKKDIILLLTKKIVYPSPDSLRKETKN